MFCEYQNKIIILLILIAFILFSVIYIAYINPGKWFFKSAYSENNVVGTIQKKQWVRMLDILVLGPFAIWLGYQLRLEQWRVVPWLLYAYGYGTIVYNFLNFKLNIDAMRHIEHDL